MVKADAGFSMVENKIFYKAQKTIDANIIKYPAASFITAGGNQFKTLWVRDFCYSVPGLLALNYTDLVKQQLKLIMQFRHENGFLPRGLDVMSPQLRVVWNILGPKLTLFNYPKTFENFLHKIKPEYLGEHNTVAFDSNILFIWAYCKYVEKTSDKFIQDEWILSLLETYEKFKVNGLFVQPAFSDWQDSACRDSAMLLFQVQYLSVLQAIEKSSIKTKKNYGRQKLQDQLLETYFSKDKYLFFQDDKKERLALEVYGFIFSENIFQDLDLSKLYLSLKESSLWVSSLIPGIPVYPRYSGSEISWTTKIVGMGGYHDVFHWGWLIAEAVKITRIVKDQNEYERIQNCFAQITESDEYLSEIYLQENKTLKVFNGFLYRSESPFTWTAAKWIEALI